VPWWTHLLLAAVCAASPPQWDSRAGIPRAASLRLRQIRIEEARVINKMWWKAADGRQETVWPGPGNGRGYKDEQREYTLMPEELPFDLIRVTGGFSGTVLLDDHARLQHISRGELSYLRIAAPRKVDFLEIERTSGTIGELACLRFEPVSPVAPAASVTAGPGRDFALETKPGWGVSAVRFSMPSRPDAYYRFTVIDPLDPSRYLAEADVHATGAWLRFELAFPAVRANGPLRVAVTSTAPVPEQVLADAEHVEFAAVREAYIADRTEQVRDLFQGLTAAGDGQILKLIDEVRAVDPANATMRAYSDWIRQTPDQPGPAGQASWTHQQIELLTLLRNAATWWIQKRQIHTGEFGGGLDGDTSLIRNWPGISLLDDRRAQWKRSARAVLDACYKEGQACADSAAGTAFLLDYGNPVLFESLLAHGAPLAAWYNGSPPPVPDHPEAPQGSLSGDLRHMARFFDLFTDAEQPTDRIWLPSANLQQTRLGGVAYGRGQIYPRHLVSWENTGGRLAVEMLGGSRTHLDARLFADSPTGRRVTMRIWGLDPGNYEITVGGARITGHLQRFTALPLDLPAMAEVRLAVRQLEPSTPLSRLPDLAIAAEEIGGRMGIDVPVHNIGSAPAGEFRVTVWDPDGAVAGQQVHSGIEPPLHRHPRIRLVRFPGLRPVPGMRIRVEPTGPKAEICNDNNEIRVYN